MKKRVVLFWYDNVPSKKNARVVAHKKVDGKIRVFVFPSKSFMRMAKRMRKSFREQIVKYDFLPFSRPVRVYYFFGQKGLRRKDASNMKQTIDDILEDVGVVVDDTLILEAHIYHQKGRYDNYNIFVIEELDKEEILGDYLYKKFVKVANPFEDKDA